MTQAFRLFVFTLSLVLCGCNQTLPFFASNEEPEQPPPTGVEPQDKLSSAQQLATPIDPEPVAEWVTEDLWQRLRNGYALGDIEHDRVEHYIRWYAKHQGYINRVSERGERYLFHIAERLEQENLPLEIALLPIIESAFDPFAYSHGRASGMWQFLTGTGRDYGLKQNWWYDGRRDVLDATDAAINYLVDLHRMFDGDWLLALAAYNTGQGNLRRAINRNKRAGKPTDFWSLRLPRETSAYVPQLLALAHIVRQPEQYGITLPPLPNTPYFSIAEIGSQLDLAQAAELAQVSMDELYLLNPGLNRWATDPAGPHRLLLPVAATDTFNLALAQIPAEQRISWERYRIQNGDSLIRIAKKHNTSVEALQAANQLSSSRIRAGDTLLIPHASKEAAFYAHSQPQRLQQVQNRAQGAKGSTKLEYTVQRGDSFWRIANRHKVTVSALARWNGMAPRDTLRPGQTLVVWSQSAKQQSSSSVRDNVTRKLSYRVREGDSLARIASRFNVSVADISRWNKVSSKNYIHPGQLLTLFIDVTQ